MKAPLCFPKDWNILLKLLLVLFNQFFTLLMGLKGYFAANIGFALLGLLSDDSPFLSKRINIRFLFFPRFSIGICFKTKSKEV